MNIVSDPLLKDALILIFGNKCDLNVMNEVEIAEKMNLQSLHHKWFL